MILLFYTDSIACKILIIILHIDFVCLSFKKSRFKLPQASDVAVSA